MTIISPYFFNGAPKTCAGCGQPCVIRAGQSEAIVGDDGRLYCYATLYERNSFRVEGPATMRGLALHAVNKMAGRSRARVLFGGTTSRRSRSVAGRASATSAI